MIVHRCWLKAANRPDITGHTHWLVEGWFLFGLIPLYQRDLQPRGIIARGWPLYRH